MPQQMKEKNVEKMHLCFESQNYSHFDDFLCMHCIFKQCMGENNLQSWQIVEKSFKKNIFPCSRKRLVLIFKGFFSLTFIHLESQTQKFRIAFTRLIVSLHY
jgi:hypothetical protein